MQALLKAAYIKAAAWHRQQLAYIVPPPRKADRIAAAFTTWLGVAEMLYWIERSVLPAMQGPSALFFRATEQQRDFERFRRIDPRSPRRIHASGSSQGQLRLRIYSSELRLLQDIEFTDLADWADTQEALDDYRPPIEFHDFGPTLKELVKEIEIELSLERGIDLPAPR